MFFRRHKFSESETSLLQRAAAWAHHPGLETLTAETLRQITQREGVDFATALLFDRFQKSPERARFIQRINALRQLSSAPRAPDDIKVVIVPGALYLERPDMGGDGRMVRAVAENFGWPTDLIPLASVGCATRNALLVRDWLSQHSGGKIILVSLSKGGADVKLAMSAPDAPSLFRNVVAWINVCGPLNGSRMADWILADRLRTGFFRVQFRWQKRDFQFITDMQCSHGSPLDFQLRPPPSMKILNLIGCPLRRHMSTRFSRFCHRTLAAWGPNDGTTSLSDLSKWPGQIYPVWATDHYFRPDNMARDLIAAVLR